MFEAVAGTAAGQPDVIEVRVAVDQEIAVAGVFVLADAGFGEGRVPESGKTFGEIAARFRQTLGAQAAISRIRIERPAVAVEGEFESAGRWGPTEPAALCCVTRA